MNWAVKAAVQKILSGLPRGDALNYVFQTRVSKNLPANDTMFELHAHKALDHFDRLRFAPHLEAATARFYEFGAGWDLIGPIVSYGLGVNHQTLVDIRPNLRFDLVNHTIQQYGKLRAGLEERAGRPLRDMGNGPLTCREELERRFGIRYLAPRDARATGFPSASFDFISNTFTLEHIPRDSIQEILPECRRILAHGGVMSSAVDVQDHYSYSDESISAFNFLKFSERRWKLINSSLHYQNRMRATDYLDLFRVAGFELLHTEAHVPTADDIRTVGELELAPRFHGYRVEDLSSRHIDIVATVGQSP